MPDSFKIGDYLEVFDDGRILVYMNCTGAIVEKKCAEFYRVGKADSIHINFSGPINDYYLSGDLAMKANIVDDHLNGEALYYYRSGQLKSRGNYKQDIKNGVWTYYYPNGGVE
ncbi:MAG: hypothetical protein LPK03_12975, partial [Pontibacter sp.]|nr:hypothetical protein [Pontibacter sp.]